MTAMAIRAALIAAAMGATALGSIGARAQDIRIDAATRLVLPRAVQGCAAPGIAAGAGLVTAELQCGEARRVLLTVVAGGGHLHSPSDRLAQASRAWRDGPAPAAHRQTLPTQAAPITLRCITMPLPSAGVELTCVRDEALTRIEIVAEAPDAAAAQALLAATLAASGLVASP